MSSKDEIRARLDLAALIGEYVQLKPVGGNRFKGLCPFHKEKTPSFQVDAARGYYYCFGCKAGGDGFSFLMAIENLSFGDALEKLADRTGVTLERKPQEKHNRDLYEINELALGFFRDALASEAGAEARAYLERRGVSPQLQEDFELGFAPAGWDALLKHAKARSVSELQLLQAGLLSEAPDTGRIYDRFRNRLMFPIRDHLGRLVGFGGRVLDDSKPKYLNTPETEIFKKGELMYGLARARNEAARSGEVVVVEGYMDVIAMHQHGFTHAVATLGTALTADHGALLARLGVSRIALMFDSDAAGQKATLAGLDQMIGSRFLVRALTLPSGKDAADALLAGDLEGVRQALSGGLSEVDFRIHSALAQYDVRSPEGKRGFLMSLLPRMQSLDLLDEVAQRIRSRAAEALGIDERRLIEWIESRAKRKTLTDVHVAGMTQDARPSEERREMFLAQQILQDPTLLGKLEGGVPFRNRLAQEIVDVARHAASREQILEHFRGRPEEKQVFEAMFGAGTYDLLPGDHNAELVEKLMAENRELSLKETESRLTESQLRAEIARLKAALAQAQAAEQLGLLSQISELQRAIEAERRSRKLKGRA
ncbi:DNA primase [Deinobacterium chartae]|uniref:DNA primase n=1 Tax=Deinobacterium chartae TaxID=521158 RepID=A0A841I1D6_9DEIO|nr:DNA primase [Deinobacterium chartae]MBB6099621.1 DNA primase [Deinobacterium chartae]